MASNKRSPAPKRPAAMPRVKAAPKDVKLETKITRLTTVPTMPALPKIPPSPKLSSKLGSKLGSKPKSSG